MAEMTPRQRWLALLDDAEVDRLPSDFWATEEFRTKLKARMGCEQDEDLWRTLGMDCPRPVHPRILRNRQPDPQMDIWGLRRRLIDYGTGHYAEVDNQPLADAASAREIDIHPWPDASDFDYEPIHHALADDDGQRPICGCVFEPFLLYCSLRGMEQSYIDLIDNEAIAHCILGHIFDFYYEHNRRIFEAGNGKIDLFYLAEDLGGQHGPLFSLDAYRRFLLPNQKKMADLARRYGVHVFYHTDGAARDFLPDLIDVVGIEVLNPLQWRCPGMSLPELVRDFGRHVVFHGGIDNQQTIPFGTPDDVRHEVRWIRQLMSRHHARWICGPCHNIQAVTPVENVLALYEVVHESNSQYNTI